jgi:hypothetical protein
MCWAAQLAAIGCARPRLGSEHSPINAIRALIAEQREFKMQQYRTVSRAAKRLIRAHQKRLCAH